MSDAHASAAPGGLGIETTPAGRGKEAVGASHFSSRVRFAIAPLQIGILLDELHLLRSLAGHRPIAILELQIDRRPRCSIPC